jgi:magnesium transporter
MIFIVLRRIIWDIDNSDLSSEQLSFILSGSKLISFQEKNDNLFNPIEQRLEKSKGRIRGSDSFYLLYSIMDMIIDRYFLVLEQIEEKIDEIEFNLQKNFDSIDVKDIHDLKHAMTVFKKYVWPLRELINNLSRTEHPLINSSNSLYFRDLTDHVYQVLDIVENHREMVSHLLDLYMTMIGNKTNDIMKVLTIIATIFIPLSFIAGVYGMNFQFMPELSSPWGYPIFWVVIIVISGILLYYFRRKKWI